MRAGLYHGAVEPAVFPPSSFADHALIDSGDARKLERFGSIVLDRPDPQALWKPRLGREAWAAADLSFHADPRSGGKGGDWRGGAGDALGSSRGEDPRWTIGFKEARISIRPSPFRHVGLFPEQATNWDWVSAQRPELGGEQPRLLNLFGYTGVASILAAQAGYSVTHVDASKSSLAWARENALASSLPSDAMRVILDDAQAFARREVRREARYAGILLDPPHQGRGPKGERWRFEDDVAALLETCGALLEEQAFLVLSSYAIGTTPVAFEGLLQILEGGRCQVGELVLPEQEINGGQSARRLPCGFCARWTRGFEGHAGR